MRIIEKNSHSYSVINEILEWTTIQCLQKKRQHTSQNGFGMLSWRFCDKRVLAVHQYLKHAVFECLIFENGPKNNCTEFMINNKIITVVLPAYNAEKTLAKTYNEIPFDIVDNVILVDDNSIDGTIQLANILGIQYVLQHEKNKGYGGNQKTCYKKALDIHSDIIVMLHPDYQYTPKLIHSMCFLIADGVYEVVLGSRILGKGALKGGMPKYKYLANRSLTLFQNTLLGQKLSEYHTGYRAFSAKVLKSINYEANSDDFIFDNQMLAQIFGQEYEIAEITCPTKYFEEASSINLKRSIHYGLGVVQVSLRYRLEKWGFFRKKFRKYVSQSVLSSPKSF